VRPAGSLFSPLDRKLRLGVEGYSPSVLWRAARQAQKAASFAEASSDLRELASIKISPTHLRRLAARIGEEWSALRDGQVAAFREKRLPPQYARAPQAAAVMVDGGRVRTRGEEAGQGVHDPAWRESKVACCQSMTSSCHSVDPQPEPPRKFLDQAQAARLACEIKSRGDGKKAARSKQEPRARKKARKKRGRRKGPKKLVRTVVASMAGSEEFGWQVAAEVQRRGLDGARSKGYVCDGQKYNWAIYEMHFLALGFLGILDFIHLLAYLYGAARASCGKDGAGGWALYEKWLRWAWGGQVKELIRELRQQSERLGEAPAGCAEDDARRVVAEALGYVRNNKERMDYPRYRMLGLPICSAAVESTIKQVNRRVKGSEKFWLEGGAEAILQLRAAHLSEDDTAGRYWAQPRPEGRAVGQGSLRPAA
jgi:hypothetical protein